MNKFYIDFEVYLNYYCKYHGNIFFEASLFFTYIFQIYDGANYKAESLAKLCGNNKSETIFSSSNEMFIVFITNGDESGDGFIANYETFIPGN